MTDEPPSLAIVFRNILTAIGEGLLIALPFVVVGWLLLAFVFPQGK